MSNAPPSVAVFLSIGSNVERERWVREALRLLRERFGALRVSGVYECPAVGFSGAPFYNLAVGFDTTESLPEIVAALRRIEDRCVREE